MKSKNTLLMICVYVCVCMSYPLCIVYTYPDDTAIQNFTQSIEILPNQNSLLLEIWTFHMKYMSRSALKKWYFVANLSANLSYGWYI